MGERYLSKSSLFEQPFVAVSINKLTLNFVQQMAQNTPPALSCDDSSTVMFRITPHSDPRQRNPRDYTETAPLIVIVTGL